MPDKNLDSSTTALQYFDCKCAKVYINCYTRVRAGVIEFFWNCNKFTMTSLFTIVSKIQGVLL